MSTTKSKLKRVSVFFAIFFTLFFVVCPLSASECRVVFSFFNDSPLENKEIEREVKSYLSNNTLKPILTDGPMKYDIGMLFQDLDTQAFYTLGILHAGDQKFVAMFSIERGWFWNATKLVCLTTDLPITPDLVEDVFCAVEAIIQKNPLDYHLLIQSVEASSEEKVEVQKWTLFTESECIDLLVLLTESPDGGTDFVVTPWLKEFSL